METALEPIATVSVQRPAVLKHADLRTYRSHIAPWLHSATGEAFTTIALMREPLDWLRSWYRFRLRDDLDDPSHAMNGQSFADFAAFYQRGEVAGVGHQADFLTDDGTLIDRIFRYDDMQSFTDYLEDCLEFEISLPRINVPPAVDVSLCADQEAELRRFMARDLALYDTL